ncbi:MAG: hypothetical protein PHU25_12960 [Deltaproteobacteria bacterium]|nr:hypothetical protein [Deltaproteobacteria bacterium]
MWTRARSSATSRRPERLGTPRARATALLALFASGAGCVVTDTIEFEQGVNHPPEVVSLDPVNDHVITVCPDTQDFSLTVWDADEADVTTYEAKIFLSLDAYVPGNWNVKDDCVVTELAPSGAQEDATGGVSLNVACQLALDIYTIPPGALLFVMIQVSDLGYSHKVVKEDARTADVVWVLEVAPSSACGQ